MRDNVLTPAFYEIVSDFEKRFREAAPDDHRYDYKDLSGGVRGGDTAGFEIEEILERC